MASKTPEGHHEPGHRPLKTYNSFPRLDPATPSPAPWDRPSTSSGDGASRDNGADSSVFCAEPDAFDSTTGEDKGDKKGKGDENDANEKSLPSDFHELPIELAALADRLG